MKKKFLFSPFALLAVFVILISFSASIYFKAIRADYAKASDHHVLARPPLSLINSQLGSLSVALTHMLFVGTIKPEDLERLDFSNPGDITYDDHSGVEVFNPDGIIKARPIAQELLDRVTLKQGTRLLYNLRRVVTENAEIKDVLYAILPDVASEACLESSEASVDIDNKHPLPIMKSTSSIELAPNNQEVLIDKNFLPLGAVCIQTVDKKNFTFFYLAYRTKKNGSNQWQKPQ